MSARTANERGASLVEFALAVPLLALLLFGVIDYSFAFSDQQNLRQSTREVARLVTTDPSVFEVAGTFSGAAVVQYVKDVAEGLTDSRLHVTWTSTGSTVGSEFTLCAGYDLKSRTALLAPFLDSRQGVSRVTMRLERAYSIPSAPADSAAPTCP